jgi:hypothetical protein
MLQEKTLQKLIYTSKILAILFMIFAFIVLLSLLMIIFAHFGKKGKIDFNVKVIFHLLIVYISELIILFFFIFYLLKYRKKMKYFLEDGTFDSLPEVANCINKMFILESLAFGVIVLFMLFLKVFPTHF